LFQLLNATNEISDLFVKIDVSPARVGGEPDSGNRAFADHFDLFVKCIEAQIVARYVQANRVKRLVYMSHLRPHFAKQTQNDIVWLLGHRPYSAAMRTGSLCGLAEYWSMRRSISGRKCAISPWIGQAAASPSAQIVWPSTSLVTSSSMSISRFCARPSAMRVITRHIQPVPSRHGVHWPQLSCL